MANWQKQLDILFRLVSGAFLFGVPMIYTMEMWWIGLYADLWKMLILLCLSFAAGILLSYFAQLRGQSSIKKSVYIAVQALAVGIVSSTIILLILNRINLDTAHRASLGMIIILSAPLSIGASAANSLLAIGEDRGRQGVGDYPGLNYSWWPTINDIGATLAGAVFIGLPLAPTAEIGLLAAEMGYVHELALIGLSLLVTYTIVFESGFSPDSTNGDVSGPFQWPITETVVAYVISLLVSLVALYLFEQIGFSDSLNTVVSRTMVLGFPAAIGGAAGRLVV